MIRMAVFVSGGGTNLQALLDSENPYGTVALVVASNPRAYAIERGRQAGIPALVFQRKKLGAAYSEKLLAALAEHRIDLVVLAGFLTILDEAVIAAYPRRILNIHPSLLPAFGGVGFYGIKVHEAALARGVKITGATVHYVNEVPDGGEIIAQRAVEVLPGDTPETLQRRVMEQAEWHILPEVVRNQCKTMEEDPSWKA